MSVTTPSQHTGREPATVRIAMWSARHRWPGAGLWFVATIGLLVVSLSMGGINASDANENPNEQQIEASKAYDVKALAELWTADAVALPPGGPVKRGPELRRGPDVGRRRTPTVSCVVGGPGA